LLAHLKKNSLVEPAANKSYFLEKSLRITVRFINKDANRSGLRQECAAQICQTLNAVPLTTHFGINIDAFNVRNVRCFADDVGFENQTGVLNPNPDAVLLDPPPAARTKSDRVNGQRIDAAFEAREGSMNRDQEIQVAYPRAAKIG
jgi:hypothetical protein